MKRNRIPVFLLCLTMIAVSLFSAAAFEWEGLDDTPTDEPTVETDQPHELAVVTDSGDARLYLDDVTGEVALENAAGKRFSSAVTAEYAGTDTDVRELFSFLTYDASTHSTNSSSSADDGVAVRYERKDDGFDAYVSRQELSFTVQFRLEGEKLTVTIPRDSVTEGEESLVSITLMPFFGASNSREDGYIFYPDGCGTLYRFADKPAVSRSAVTKLIYGDAVNELDDYTDDREHNIQPLTVPAFGIKRGDAALFARIGEGAADTELTLAPDGYIYNLSRVYPTFRYRYNYEEKTVSGDGVIAFGDLTVDTDFSVTYSILSGDDASYIGMAERLRSELFADGRKAEKPKLSVDLLMTTQKSLLLWDADRTVTTFAQAKDLLDTLDGLGVDRVRLNLLGWQSKGYNCYPAHLPVSGAAGGMKGLKALTDAAGKNGSQIYLQDNYAEADFAEGGFSVRRDAAYNMKNKPLTDSEQTKLLLDIGRSYTDYTTALSKLKNTGISGYSFDLFGSLVYDNTASGRELRRQEYTDTVREYLTASNETFGSVAADGGNYYALEDAGFLYNLPDRSSEEFIYDEDVPFLQILLHGYRPYSGGNYGNFSNSEAAAVLHWLEYGYVPSFVLGYQSPGMLKDTKSEGFFYSRIGDWTDTIGEICKTFLPTYERIADQTIVGYERDGDIRRIGYEDGSTLILNYGREAVETDGLTVGALSYAFR